jgi:hypothetical protein
MGSVESATSWTNIKTGTIVNALTVTNQAKMLVMSFNVRNDPPYGLHGPAID